MFPSRQKVLLVYPTCFLNSFLGPCKALLRKDLSDMFYIDGLEQMLVNVRLHLVPEGPEVTRAQPSRCQSRMAPLAASLLWLVAVPAHTNEKHMLKFQEITFPSSPCHSTTLIPKS